VSPSLNYMSNDTIKVSGWITDGAPAKYGVQLATDEVLPLKEKEFTYLHNLWLKLFKPTIWFNKQLKQIQLGIKY